MKPTTAPKANEITSPRWAQRGEPFELREHRGWVEGVVREAAQTKHNIPDFINHRICELTRRRFELPVFSVLLFAIVLGILFASRTRMVIPSVIAEAALWGWASRALGP